MRPIPPFSLLLLLAAAPFHGAVASTYEGDIFPIVERACIKCHNNDKMKGGVSVEPADMKSDIGRIVVPGDPVDSMFLEVLVDPNAANPMPPKGRRLPDADIAKIRQWIEEGARFRGDPEPDAEPAPAAPAPVPGTWTNKAGKEIQADLLRVEGDRAVLRLANGKVYQYPLDDLSPESAAKARQAFPAAE